MTPMGKRLAVRTTVCVLAVLVIFFVCTADASSNEKTSPAERLNNYRKRVSREFIKTKAQLEGAITLPSGLVIEQLVHGTGTHAAALDDECKLHYVGSLRDGTVFDSSRARGAPATFRPNQVISGWTEALQLMREGDHWRIYVPYELGYGERGAGRNIPPYAALAFDIELLSIEGGGKGRTAAEVGEVLKKAVDDKEDM
ncbi:macrophage infectivity potentiator, precursor [Trypanosoma grayi]|uniref:macrophage infectivity potentiator, precursor n=1 Tax=Trypanosoma grayi TaxID=71804 RepID=UPI0004F40800|nr:macrophage infectivity potentiator, precursor [Trypanosoma grayi]KEG12658.1 macrophage infectivity potentiator, precursor [Trypanosoma grayi]